MKRIKVFGGKYEVCSDGRVWSNNRGGMFLKPSFSTTGYCQVALCENGVHTSFLLHRLIAKCFVDGYQDGLIVSHLDGNKLNNNAANLQWRKRREVKFFATLSVPEVIAIKKDLSRQMTGVSVARKYGVSVSTVSRIKRGENWSHI
tara:strand:- start:11158 stop:11595 length:438 start_codon:yes stop_codon:yes gene_type:complete